MLFRDATLDLGQEASETRSPRRSRLAPVCGGEVRGAGEGRHRGFSLGRSASQAGTLQEMGGWSSAEMVRRYPHRAADHLSPYAEKLCRPLAAVPETLGTNWSQS
jgi:hypothetical protein